MLVSWSLMSCLCFQNQGNINILPVAHRVIIILPFRLFYTTLRERVDKYFKENNIVREIQ